MTAPPPARAAGAGGVRHHDAGRRPPPTPAQRRHDVAVGLGLAVLAVVSFELTRSLEWGVEERPGIVEQTVWALAVSLPLCLRRRFPVAVVVVVAAAFIGLQARMVFETLVSNVCLFLALFTVGAWSADRRVGLAARVVVVVAMFSWLGIALATSAWREELDGSGDPGLLPPVTALLTYVTLTNVLYFAGAWVFGDQAWRGARDAADLVTRNAELLAERAANARRAVVEERVRIARELHDVVAHHVAVMGVQAGAARSVLATDPAAAARAMAAVEGSSREAVDEMRRLLGILRDEPGPGDPVHAAHGGTGDEDGAGEPDRSPPAGVEALPGLVDRAGHPGLVTSFTSVGAPVDLPRPVSVSLYRVVQEALTNTVRHSAASRVDVRLRWFPGAVEVEVVDDGRGTGTSSGSGLGLVGMRERVEVHDGVLDAGPRPVGGFRVRARMPLAAAPAVVGAARERAAAR